jgi:hypothetical protein
VKLRLRNDTMRIRLSQSEVRMLGEGSAVESTTHFGPGQALAYRIVPAGAKLEARFEGLAIDLRVPLRELSDWAAGSELTFECEQAWSGGALKISLEKDLACKQPRKGDEDSDAFPNPANASHCG